MTPSDRIVNSICFSMPFVADVNGIDEESGDFDEDDEE